MVRARHIQPQLLLYLSQHMLAVSAALPYPIPPHPTPRTPEEANERAQRLAVAVGEHILRGPLAQGGGGHHAARLALGRRYVVLLHHSGQQAKHAAPAHDGGAGVAAQLQHMESDWKGTPG